MSSAGSLTLAVFVLLLLHGSTADEERLTINMMNVSDDQDKIYTLEVPSDGRVNFTAMRPVPDCYMHGKENNVSFAVGGSDDDCIMMLWWINVEEGGEGILFKTTKDEKAHGFTSRFNIDISLMGDKITVTNGSVPVYTETTLDNCAMKTFTSQYGTNAINFTVKRQNAHAIAKCKEIAFKFASGITIIHPHTTTPMPYTSTVAPPSEYGEMYIVAVLGAAGILTVVFCLLCVCVCCRKSQNSVSAAKPTTKNGYTPLISSEAKSEGPPAS